jgi:hypothetical protein
MASNGEIQREFQYLLGHLNDSVLLFDPDTTDYETTHERLEARKADDIAIRMEEVLTFGRQQLEKMKQATKAQVNKHRRDVTYEVNPGLQYPHLAFSPHRKTMEGNNTRHAS